MLACKWMLLAVIVAVSLFSRVQAQPPRGEKYAFLVVCSKYNSTQLRDLPYTIEEMEDFRAALLKTGFDADHIILLHDKGERERLPEKAKIEKQFRLLLNGLQANDTVIVAINGHGVHFKGDKVGYYCPLGADLNNKKSLVSMEFFYDLLKKSKAKQKLMIVQACQNDPFVSNDFAAERLEFTEKSDEVPEGIAAIFSCMEGQKSYYDPDRKRGLFFDHVIRSWNGEYLRAGDSKLDLESFFQQVRVKTKADALKFRGGVEQVPEVRREYKGEWVLTADLGREFFNGTDLAGWEGLIDRFWSVKDGAIVGTTNQEAIKFNTFLCSKRKYKDFEIQFKVKLSSGNSGVQIRSRIHDREKFRVTGPQCDMGGEFWGCLFNENAGGIMKVADQTVVKEILRVDDFNDYYIRCIGKNVTIKLNGKTTVDETFPTMPDEGIIAFQIHGGTAIDVTFKNIQFKEIK